MKVKSLSTYLWQREVRPLLTLLATTPAKSSKCNKIIIYVALIAAGRAQKGSE